jgi:hypothetical protein
LRAVVAGLQEEGKQVDLKDGAMRIFIHAEANHAVSVTHTILTI